MEITKEIIKFTRELVKIPSQNGIDSEREIARFIFKKLRDFGFLSKIIDPKEHPSVICYLKKPKAKKTIWLESCIDTVLAGNFSKWKYPPFKGVIKKNRMYGRGVADSKIGIAIFCYLAKILFENPEFTGNIFLGFDADEQSGNFTGIKEVLKQAPKADICILGYQGREEISIGGRGFLRFKLTVLGKSAHTGARYNRGINAIHKMEKAINLLFKSKFLKAKEDFFEFGSSLNISQIKGGVAINIVPSKCEALVDIRFLPSQNSKMIMEEIKNSLGEIKKEDREFNFKIKILNYQEAFLSNPKHPFFKLIQKNFKKYFKKEIPLRASGAGSVGNLIASKIKVPILNSFGCQDGNVHLPNEWINISDLPKIFEIYEKSLIEFSKT